MLLDSYSRTFCELQVRQGWVGRSASRPAPCRVCVCRLIILIACSAGRLRLSLWACSCEVTVFCCKYPHNEEMDICADCMAPMSRIRILVQHLLRILGERLLFTLYKNICVRTQLLIYYSYFFTLPPFLPSSSVLFLPRHRTLVLGNRRYPKA